jgi:hypothetical protein
MWRVCGLVGIALMGVFGIIGQGGDGIGKGDSFYRA